jgi:muramoyltetrapeptide carboxypeptidase
LAAAGFSCRLGAHIHSNGYHLAGSSIERCSDLQELLQDPEVDALIAARGGFGCLHLLSRFDYGLAATTAKPVVGFSDVTALQLALWHKCRLVTFSGPMLAVELARPGRANEELLWAQLGGAGLDHINAMMSDYMKDERVEFLRPANFFGFALGGNLTVLASLAGSSYMPDFTGAIIFLEDRGEPLYRIDRALSQLRLAGVFQAPAAVVCGDFSSPRSGEESMLTEFLCQFFGDDSFPVILNFNYGHCQQSFVFPQGIDMQIACQKREIMLAERPVIADGS